MFRSTKAAIKLHTLLDLRGNIPTFIHISDGKMHEVNILVGEIQLDGNLVEGTPPTIGVSAGDHVITINKNGYRPWERRVKTSTGGLTIAADLEADVKREQKTEAAVPPQTSATPSAAGEPVGVRVSETFGTMSLTSDPYGAYIYADRLFLGKTPATLRLRPGSHNILLLMRDYKNYSQEITAEVGSEVYIRVFMEKSN